jgi:glucuronoarabinoxylan endo-1,4-beta-xylanase
VRRKTTPAWRLDVDLTADDSGPSNYSSIAMMGPKNRMFGSYRLLGKSNFSALLLASSSVSVALGCGSNSQEPFNGGNSIGGAISNGGAGLGGTSATSQVGGAPATGGLPSSSGGNATGGTSALVPTGGKAATGGAAAGGAATGGKSSAGGASTGGDAAGGSDATGGAAGRSGGGRSGAGAGGGSSKGGAPAGGGGGKAAGGSAAGGVPAGGSAPTGGVSAAGDAGKTPGTAAAGAASVNPSKEYQTMDGFGIADVWIGKATHTAALRTLFWDPDNGIGMTLVRVGIDETGKIMGDAAFVDAPDVVKYGGKVWAAPWTPPANLKDNNNINNGGHLNTASYDTWATTLAAFPAYFKQNAGVDLWGLSAQNEPDFVASYRSCIFNASQMNAFIKVLGPKLAALNPPVKLIAAEPDVWSHTWNDGDKFGASIEGDATVSSLVEIIATHDYGSNVSSWTRPSPPSTLKHHLWETEIYYTAGAAIGPGLDLARGIYAGINAGGASGWHYWWTTHFMDGGSASSPPKRVYTMGNYSKFVRPGYVRVDITGLPSSLHATAFQNPADHTVVVVVINDGTSSVTLPVFVAGTNWPASVTPYVTDSSKNLAAQTAITVTAANFSATIGAQSVTTLVGKP